MRLKPIKGYESLYEISDNGNIYSCEKIRIRFYNGKEYKSIFKRKELKQALGGNKYLHIWLYKNNKGKCFDVHVLVAKAFILNPQNKPEVNHKDCNKQNNSYRNLEWVTQKENDDHAIINKLKAAGDKHGNSKATRDLVLRIKEKYRQNPKYGIQKELAKEFSLSQSIISRIILGKTWKNI